MRKTRLVILPTKCLHQMGFLLLFLSCPVIGDWGRIRPESENSHKAIQIQREGTCGLQRDPPGGLLDVLNENGPRQCKIGEDNDLIKSTREPTSEMSFTRRMDERRVDSRRTNQRRTVREERNVRALESRRERTVRSRSVETRRSRVRSPERSERIRSLSLSRLENERAARGQRNDIRDIPRRAELNSRRLSLTRRVNERQEERRMEQRRLRRETRNERREDNGRRDERRADVERADRVTEGRGTRREDTERLTPRLSMNRRQNDATRDRNQRDVRERNERRLSLTRMEQDSRRMERMESRRNSERRIPEIRSTRRTRSVELSRNNVEREEAVRMSRNVETRREMESRRLVSLSPKRVARVASLDRKADGIRRTRATVDTASPAPNDDLSLENKKNEGFFEGLTKWADMKDYESPRIGDWTTNCVVGAVAYFLTSRQVKTV